MSVQNSLEIQWSWGFSKDHKGQESTMSIYTPPIVWAMNFHFSSSHIELRVDIHFFEERGVNPMSHYCD